jgi:hypothetical protein
MKDRLDSLDQALDSRRLQEIRRHVLAGEIGD